MEKKPLIVGNWKMYKTAQDAKAYIVELLSLVVHSQRQILLAVPFTAIDALKNGRILIGAQNMHDELEGAFTGEISALMLKDAGAQFVILGHSERRHIFHEDNLFINRKVKRAISEGLTVILCVGETEKERLDGKTKEVLKKQLKECLAGVESREKLIVAYEPVWAIGTGKTATPAIAEEAHKLCREFLADKTPLLYGGSVKPDNISALMHEPNIDGVLVGGASLSAKTFAEIINYK